MATAIQVVLHQDVENLGNSGDVVKVRPGYARNYLIPRGLAVVANKASIARVEDIKKAAKARAAKQLEEAREFATKLENVAIKLERAVGDENKMYGSVTGKDIEEAYAALGYEFDKKDVELSEPIKTLGLHDVPLRLHREVRVTLKVEVIKKSS
ncbi:MAG: 50S ribosomal protein L9 [Polyangiaceae bacterium]